MAAKHNDIRAVEQAEAEQEYREAQADASFAKEVLRRTVDWHLLHQEGRLTPREANLLLGYDQQDANTQADVLAESGPALAGLLVKVLASVANIETVEYTVVLLDQLFGPAASPSSAGGNDQAKKALGYFLAFQERNPSVDLAAPLMQLLLNSGPYNPFALLRVQHILSLLLPALVDAAPAGSHQADAYRTTLARFLRQLITKMSSLSSSSPAPPQSANSSASAAYSPYTASAPSSATREIMACLAALKNVLRASPRNLQLFADNDGVRAICALLNKDTQNAQLLYLVGFNLWLLSFDARLAKSLQEQGVIKKIVHVVKVNVMEKVIRIGFSILRNFLEHGDDSYNEDMIGHGLVGVIDALSKRKFKDGDIASDMARIGDVLADTIRSMSTWEKYAVEVGSGALSWSNPAHRNEVFWRENIMQFDARNFALVQQLIKLAEPPASAASPNEREEVVREVACFDLGEFARFHPEGKKVLQRLGGKNVLMKNLQDRNAKISKAALLATQKLMVANWEFLNKSSSGGVASLMSQANKK